MNLKYVGKDFQNQPSYSLPMNIQAGDVCENQFGIANGFKKCVYLMS